MNFTGIIPARYASTRFPGKPLVIIQGKSMIQRVYEQAKRSKKLSDVVVATDDKRIADHVKSFGGKFIMTSAKHRTGTERCAEVSKKLRLSNKDVVINIQGDEPFIDPAQIDVVCKCFENKETQIATLVKKISDTKELFNPNVVKAVFDKNNFALYFSRNPIPYLREDKQENWLKQHDYYKHIGIYGYKAEVLAALVKLKSTALEKAESLEQLRWLENGYKIKIQETKLESVAIDTPNDLEVISNFKFQISNSGK